MLRDRVEQQSLTSGPGPYTLDLTVTGKRAVASVFPNGVKVRYLAVAGAAWEHNEGTLNTGVAPAQLSRDRLINSSTGSAVNWPDASPKQIIVDAGAELFGPLGGQLITAAVGGTVNAITLSTSVETPVLADGMTVEFEAAGAPAAAVTVALNALPAKTLLHKSGDQAGAGSWEGTARLRATFDQSLDAWVLMAGHRLGWNKGADIASAATLVKPADARDGSYHRVTGAVGVANLWTGAPPGIEHELEVVSGFTLTDGANLVVAGGTIALVAGDLVRVRHIASNVWFAQVTRASGMPLVPFAGMKTISGTTYTVTAADAGLILQFSNAGGCTVTLPTVASVGPGFEFSALSSPGDVTFNVSGSDLFLGGGASYIARVFNELTGPALQRFSSGHTGLRWFTGERRFRSAQQTISAGGLLTVAHGMGAIPRQWWFELECVTAELGFSVGHRIIYPANYTLNAGASNSKGATMLVDGTNLYVRFGSIAAGIFAAPRFDTGVGTNLTDGSWRLRLCAVF